MDFRDLTYIIAVADNKSVTEAASKLYISQPSLSYIISKVEEELGVKLFYRKTNPITLTYAGQLYVETARQILGLMDNLKRELNDVGIGEKGRINIGIPTERAGYMLPKVMKPFNEKFPEMELRLIESRSEAMLEELDKGKISMAVLPGKDQDYPANMTHELIYRENILLIAGDGVITDDLITSVHDDGIPQVDLRKMKQAPFIILQKGHYIRLKTDRIFKRAGFVPKNVTEVSSNISAALLARAGIGIALVPERAIETLGGRKAFNVYHFFDEGDSWNVNVVYKKDTYLGKAERYLITIMQEAFRDIEKNV